MKMCAFCGDYFEPKHTARNQKYCKKRHQQLAWYKRKNEGLVISALGKEIVIEKNKKGSRWSMIYKNSSPDAIRQLAGLNPLEIKGAITYSELDGKEVNHIYENLELNQ